MKKYVSLVANIFNIVYDRHQLRLKKDHYKVKSSHDVPFNIF